MCDLIYVCAVIAWLMGISLAPSPGTTAIAAVFPPYAWYVVVENAMRGWCGS